MKLTITGVTPYQPIPGAFAFAVPDPQTHVRLSDNRNPAVAWSGVPDGTRSVVLLCMDADAPTDPGDANREGRTIPTHLARADFYHWVMVDIPPTVAGIAEGVASNGITARGKQDPAGPVGSRQGVNGYTDWFKGDADMEGQYFGYDGPCPPWNDLRVHHYHFRVLATDLTQCPVDAPFDGATVVAAINGHVLDWAEVVATYTLNPRVQA